VTLYPVTAHEASEWTRFRIVLVRGDLAKRGFEIIL
jgi:hypothetical protein